MTRKQRLVIVAGGVLMVAGLAFGSLARAQEDSGPREGRSASTSCSNHTVRGDYGFSIDGTILAGTPNAFLLRGVAITHFDGNGSLTQVDFTTRNGAPVGAGWRPAVGSYASIPTAPAARASSLVTAAQR